MKTPYKIITVLGSLLIGGCVTTNSEIGSTTAAPNEVIGTMDGAEDAYVYVRLPDGSQKQFFTLNENASNAWIRLEGRKVRVRWHKALTDDESGNYYMETWLTNYELL
jgi:hypothetical protein